MAWIYLAESAGFTSAYLHGYPQPLIVRQTHTARESFCREWHRGKSERLQYGMTLEPLNAPTWNELPLTLSSEDSRARTLALQELEKAWEESEVDYSLKSSDWLASFDLSSFSWKTSQLSLFEGLIEFSWSSLRSGTIVDGRLYQPQRLEPSIFVNDGSFLPTPTACDYGKNVGRKSDGITPSGRDRWSITVRAKRGELPGHPKGKLHPEWIEQAMGYPVRWTELEDWAIAWFRFKRVKRSCG